MISDVFSDRTNRTSTIAIRSSSSASVLAIWGRTSIIAIGNNGNYTCDATALRLRVYATDKREETPVWT